MEFKEFQVLCKGMRAVYTQPNFLPDEFAIKMWYKLLQDIPYDVLSVAIQQHMMSSKFPPTVAELRELSTTMVQGKPKDWGDSWESVLKAIRSYGYYRETEGLESLDETTRQVVKRLGWKELCMSENIMNDRANFRMIHEQLTKRQKEDAVLSIGVKQKANNLLEAFNEGLLAIAEKSKM